MHCFCVFDHAAMELSSMSQPSRGYDFVNTC
ncbi:hypothetical protein OIU79_013682 [Salix purpurea]|uniref:Uncharacterized protein n=1 Tax=Salix purpurea TaxID=77065 RepID=A0A9Q0PNU4_SALPP|nr:hypothetical protein OIU79_013682 [Salix purpurea]